MKALNPIIATLLFLLNLVCGLILPQYEVFNIIMTSVIIILNAVLIFIASSILNDAFKISTTFLFSLFGFVECVLSILSPQELESNYYLVGICLLVTFEILILVCAKFCQR